MYAPVTEYEYRKALHTIKAYREQCEEHIKMIDQLVGQNHEIVILFEIRFQMSCRLFNILFAAARELKLVEKGKIYSDLTLNNFVDIPYYQMKSWRNMGSRSIMELDSLFLKYKLIDKSRY